MSNSNGIQVAILTSAYFHHASMSQLLWKNVKLIILIQLRFRGVPEQLLMAATSIDSPLFKSTKITSKYFAAWSHDSARVPSSVSFHNRKRSTKSTSNHPVQDLRLNFLKRFNIYMCVTFQSSFFGTN